MASRHGHLAGAGARATFPFRGIATSRVALLAMTMRNGCTLGWRRGEGAPPYRDFTDKPQLSRDKAAIITFSTCLRVAGSGTQPQGGEPPPAFGLRRGEGAPPYRDFTDSRLLSRDNTAIPTLSTYLRVAGFGTQSQVSRRLFCTLFSSPEKSVIPFVSFSKESHSGND